MHPEPAPADRGRDEDPAAGVPEPVEYESVAWEPVVTRPDPMSEEDQQALLDAVTDDGEPWWLQEGDPDPDDPPPPEDYNLQEIAAQLGQDLRANRPPGITNANQLDLRALCLAEEAGELADAYRRKFGGDHIDDVRGALAAYITRIGWRES